MFPFVEEGVGVNRVLFSFVLLFVVSAETICADTIYLTPSADTALLEAFPSNNFGGQLYLNAGTTQNFTKNRGLLKFDVAGQLPANAKITSARLTFEVTRSPSDDDHPSTFELRRVLRDWGEGNKSGEPPLLGAPATTNEANWIYRFALTTNTWSMPGGESGLDFATVSSGEQYIYGPNFSPYTFDPNAQMTADVQNWLQEPGNNFGWMLLTQAEGLDFTARRFASREDSNRAPILEVNYFIPQINQITLSSNSLELRFLAEADQPYTVEFRTAVGQSSWQILTNVPASVEQTNHVVTDSLSRTQRFYRLVLP